MNAWLAATVALTVTGLAPALWLGSRGSPVDRLIALELTGAVTALDMLLFAQVSGRSIYLIVPLVLVLMSFAGTLVFTRLLGPRS